MKNMYLKALNQMCSNCKNHDMCQGTGCEPKKDMMVLVKLSTPSVPYKEKHNAWCPNCGYQLGKVRMLDGLDGKCWASHCPACGQFLNWSNPYED